MPVLHYHPLSSYCQKVCIAIEVLEASIELRFLDLARAEVRTELNALWPLGKIPLLVDQGRVIPESSIIIEYLQHASNGPRLIPGNTEEALDVRLWDRFMDNHVMMPMQVFTANLLKPEGKRDADATAAARQTLLTSYGLIDRQLEGRLWIAGDGFSLADCAAAPALFYAVTYVPLPAELQRLSAYFERLMDHPAVAAVINAARPYFKYYPGRAGLSCRFRGQDD